VRASRKGERVNGRRGAERVRLGATFAALLLAAPWAAAATGPALGAARADFVQSSAAGDRLRPLPPVRLAPGPAPAGVVIRVELDSLRQRIEGVGGSLTEASAYVLAQLPKAVRRDVVASFFGPGGADLTMARTHIGACDFTVAGKYSYDDVAGDVDLAHFSVAHDKAGFPGARDPHYALLPLLHEALSRQPALAIVASPWTAPAWMKDNGEFYTQGKAGGGLLPQHYTTFARYIARYVSAYASEGVRIWAVTPVNEPLGVGGQWESMEMSPGQLHDYVAGSLGPALAPTGVRILQYDQNRDPVAVRYASAMLGDSASARYVWGTAVHWYGSTISPCGDVLDAIHALDPAKGLLHTEGCVDALGSQTNSPGGRFVGWRNDAWWWRREATDWGWDWAAPEDKPQHPRYAPVHRYARDLIGGMNHWLSGWIDWNIVLDSRGGPNHVNNWCAAPVMVDVATGGVYYTPLYFTIAHFSRYLRPGDHVVGSAVTGSATGGSGLQALAALDQAGRHLTVIVLNETDEPLPYTIDVGSRHAAASIPGNAIQTLRFDLNGLKR
jgi:glucosylceramidase